MIPHPDKKHKGGEDASFACSNLLSVADGVGGWADLGIDPGIYSKKLCKLIKELWEKDPSKYKINLTGLISEAHNLNREKGSTTVVLMSIDNELPLLRTSMIGDSGFQIFRKAAADSLVLVYQSKEQ